MHVVSRHTERGHIHRTGLSIDVWFNELLAGRSYYTMHCVLGLIATPVNGYMHDMWACMLLMWSRVPWVKFVECHTTGIIDRNILKQITYYRFLKLQLNTVMPMVQGTNAIACQFIAQHTHVSSTVESCTGQLQGDLFQPLLVQLNGFRLTEDIIHCHSSD